MLDTLGERFGREFEMTLLYVILFDTPLAETMADGVSTDLFREVQHREIAATFNRLRKMQSGSLPTYKTVLSELKRRRSALGPESPRYDTVNDAVKRLVRIGKRDSPTAADIGYLQTNLKSFITGRSTQLALLECVEYVESEDFDKIREIITEATQSGMMRVSPTLGLEFSDAEAKIDAYTSRRTSKNISPMGIPLLDKMMRGGLEPGNLGMLMAATGIGKTMGLINVGTAALLRHLNVVHITLEIADVDVALRYDARMMGYPINELMRNAKRYKDKIRASTNKLKSRLFIKQWGSDEVSAYDVRGYLRTLQMKEGIQPHVLIVDYADLLCPIEKRREVRFELRDTVRSLRQLAYEFNCAVWTASQVNKEGFDAELLSLRTIAEASEKACVADIIFGMCQTNEERRKKRMRMLVLKNRQGGEEQRVVDCVVNTTTQTITENPTQISKIGKRRKRL